VSRDIGLSGITGVHPVPLGPVVRDGARCASGVLVERHETETVAA
jgi:hypothetical protein